MVGNCVISNNTSMTGGGGGFFYGDGVVTNCTVVNNTDLFIGGGIGAGGGHNGQRPEFYNCGQRFGTSRRDIPCRRRGPRLPGHGKQG